MELDKEYEKDWFEGEKGKTLSLENIFWTGNICVILVSLTEKQLPFFLMPESGSLITLQGQRPDTV